MSTFCYECGGKGSDQFTASESDPVLPGEVRAKEFTCWLCHGTGIMSDERAARMCANCMAEFPEPIEGKCPNCDHDPD